MSISLAAKFGRGSSTLTTFARHTDPKQTIGHAKGDEAVRMKAALAVQGIDVDEQKSK